MRLKEIQLVLSRVNSQEQGLTFDYSNNTLGNLNKFKGLLSIIEFVPIYEGVIARMRESELFQTTQNYLSIEREKGLHIYHTASYITDSASSLSRVLGELLPESEESSINVKLPEPNDFEDLIKTMATVQKSLSQVVVHKDIDGSVRINNWEHGSFWVELILGTTAAVSTVSSVIWAAAVISKKLSENEVLEKTVRSLEIKNESLEDILNRQKELTRLLVEAETNQVIDKHYSEKDPEQIKRVESSIKTFAKLIKEGAEVHPTLMAPEEVKNLFPNYKKIDLIESQIKRLEQLPKDHPEDTG